MVKIYKSCGGKSFTYAHFLCDNVLPCVIRNIQNEKKVYRLKTIEQTIGNFNKIWNMIFDGEHIEVCKKIYDSIKEPVISVCRDCVTPKDYLVFQKYMYNRFNICKDASYPKVLLIEREERHELVSDDILKKFCKKKTGKELREINNIEKLKSELNKNYKNYKCVQLAKTNFRDQLQYFYNAEIIIAAHGAALSNLLFCRPNTIIVEVVCDKTWPFFDVVSNTLKLEHYKCEYNNVDAIMGTVNLCYNLKNKIDGVPISKDILNVMYSKFNATMNDNTIKYYELFIAREKAKRLMKEKLNNTQSKKPQNKNNSQNNNKLQDINKNKLQDINKNKLQDINKNKPQDINKNKPKQKPIQLFKNTDTNTNTNTATTYKLYQKSIIKNK